MLDSGLWPEVPFAACAIASSGVLFKLATHGELSRLYIPVARTTAVSSYISSLSKRESASVI